MASIWLDQSAPYVLVVALGAMGWVVNTSVGDLKETNLVEYEIHDVISGGAYYKTVDIYNRSLKHNVASGKFTFRCDGVATKDCFVLSSTGTPITFVPTRGVAYASAVTEGAAAFEAQARLAAQSAVQYRVRMRGAEDGIVLLYEPASDQGMMDPGLIFRPGHSWEGWLIDNYLSTLVRVFLGLAGLLGLWLAGSLISLVIQTIREARKAPEPKEPQTFRVILVQQEAGHA
jgi:hypothetical protein